MGDIAMGEQLASKCQYMGNPEPCRRQRGHKIYYKGRFVGVVCAECLDEIAKLQNHADYEAEKIERRTSDTGDSKVSIEGLSSSLI